jgi:uncharacterized protein (TIGR02246 family)
MRQLGEIDAGIRQLYAHYTDAVWRKDAAAFGECFTTDAEWRISGMVLQGREQIAAGFAKLTARADRVLMQFQTPLLDWRGGADAVGRVYVTERCSWVDDAPNTNIGRYYERYFEADGRWRFSWRLFQLLYKGPPDMSGAFHDHPDYGAWPAMPPADAIPDAAPGRADFARQ